MGSETIKQVEGTWRFNENVDVSMLVLERVGFVSNGTEFSGIDVCFDQVWYSTMVVYDKNNNGWKDEAYRTITFTEKHAVTDEFYTWITGNATQQSKTIKAGTYRFNDVITDTPEIIEQQINFSVSGYVYWDVISALIDIGADVSRLESGPVTIKCNKIIASKWQGEPGGEYTTEVQYHVYESDAVYTVDGVEYNMFELNYAKYVYNSEWKREIEEYRTIAVAEDTEVSEEFYLWFMANAEKYKVIKAGIYRFNEVLTLANLNCSRALKYTVHIRRNIWDADVGDFVYIVEEQNGYSFYIATDCFAYYTDIQDAFVYDADGGWREKQADVARVITIAYDQEIPGEFYEWLVSNTSVLTASITYNSESTDLFGEETATLACNGKKMKSDIYVVFNSNGSITYNGTKTEVEKGKGATLKCAGKKMLTDLMITTENVIADELAGTWLLNESVGTVEPKAWVLCTLDGYFNGIVSKTFELQEIPLKQIYLGNGGGVFYIQLCSDACGYPISKATSGYPISCTGYYSYAGSAKAGWECDYYSSKTDYVFFTENNYIASLDDKGHYCEDISQDNVPLRTFTITTTLAEYTKREPEEAELLMKWLKNNANKLN